MPAKAATHACRTDASIGMERVSLAANPQRSSLMPAASMTCFHPCSSWLRKLSFRRRLAPARRRAKRLTSARSARSNAAGGTSTSMGTSHTPPSPRRLCRLNPSINRTRPSANRKSGAERSTGFTRAVSIRGTGDVIPSVAGIDDDCCGASFLGGVSFACSGQTNSDFGGTAPTFLYQHLRPSISRHAHQPDSDFGVLRHSIACADEVATQQQTSRVVTSAFMTGFESTCKSWLIRDSIQTHYRSNPDAEQPRVRPRNLDTIRPTSNLYVSN